MNRTFDRASLMAWSILVMESHAAFGGMLHHHLPAAAMQSQATGVWLLGKAVSAFACLGLLLWLSAGLWKRILSRSQPGPAKNGHGGRVQVEIPLKK